MIEIDKNVPPPVNGRVIGVLLDKMLIGESCLIPSATPAVKSAIYYQVRGLKASGKKFMSRKDGEGVRVWRLA
jgi:Leu/Phe-tRNA-protein transferase